MVLGRLSGTRGFRKRLPALLRRDSPGRPGQRVLPPGGRRDGRCAGGHARGAKRSADLARRPRALALRHAVQVACAAMKDSLVVAAAALAACASAAAQQTSPGSSSAQVQQASPSDPRQFVAKVNEDLKRLMVESSTADWIKNTYITDDTERNAASANERLLAYSSEAAKTATKFKALPLDPDTSRMLYLLRIASPVIEDPARRLEMTSLAARLEGHYGAAKDAQGRDLEDLSKIVERSRDYDELLDAWRSWHDTARPQRQRYERFVQLQNEGARGAGFANMGDMWRAAYDMPPEQSERETER